MQPGRINFYMYLRSLHSLSYFPLVRLHVRDYSGAEQLSVQSCCPPRLRPLQLLHRSASNCCSPYPSTSAAARRLRPLIRYSCSLLLLDCVRFGCSSPIASESTAAPRLRLLQLQLPDCIRFDCCSPIASACSLTCSGRFHPMPNVLKLSL